MKNLIAILLMSMFSITAFAQQASSSASQSAILSMSDAIDISFVSVNTVNLQFTTVNDYANGVESGDKTILVRSNQKFNVRVKAQSSKFSYAGSISPAPNMPVSPVLKLKVTANNTGGTISSGFNNYQSPSTSGSKIINNARAGGNNTFSVKYFANPGFTYPAGIYSVDIVYTATKA